MSGEGSSGEFDALAGPVRDWFEGAFPGGPTEAQRLAWPLIASGAASALDLADGDGQDARGVPGDHRRDAPGARGGDAHAGPSVCLHLAPAEPGLRHRAEPGGPPGGDPAGLGMGCEPGDGRRADRRHHGGGASEAARQAAAPPDHHAREPVAHAEPVVLARALAWRPATDRRRGPCADADEAGGRPGGLAGAVVGAGRSRPEPGGAVGDLPPARSGRSVPGRAGADLPGRRGRSTGGLAADRRGGRVAPEARRGHAPRPLLSSPPAPAEPRTAPEPDDGGLRQHPGVRRADHARPPPVARRVPRRDRRPPLGARRGASPSRRGGAEGRGVEGGRHQHEPGAGGRYRLGRPLGPDRPARQRLAVHPASRAVGAPMGRGLARPAARLQRRRAGRRGRHGGGDATGSGRAVAIDPGTARRALPAVDRHGLRRRVGGRRRLRPDPTRRPDGRPDPRRLRRLPRLPGRRPRRAPGSVRARARRRAARELAADLASDGACSGSAIAA